MKTLQTEEIGILADFLRSSAAVAQIVAADVNAGLVDKDKLLNALESLDKREAAIKKMLGGE